MDRPFQYLEEAAEPEGTALGVGVSLTLHVAVLLILFFGMRQAAKNEENRPLQFVQLVPQLASPSAAPPRSFTEAPGPAVEQPAPPAAAFSDANRRASAPQATGSERTARPGDGSGGLHIPGVSAPSPGADARPQPVAPPATGAAESDDRAGRATADDRLAYRVASRERKGSSSTAAIDWDAAIRDTARSQPAGSGGRVGGEQGYAEAGPISFETQWYDWGPYAAAMVAKIRLHWYQNMPEVVRLGLKGVVVIRFTIQRDGRITDITTLQSSGIPPFDFAAAKAIELASPLAPLPKDFPENDERVTAAFYYNQEAPAR